MIVNHLQVAPEKHSCNVCDKMDDTLRCGRCLKVWYCSKECQAKDWKSGHKAACKTGAPSKNIASDSPKAGALPKIEKPFTRLEHDTFLHDLPEKDVYVLLIDAFRMRQEDEYQHGEPDEDSIYGGEPTSIIPFRRFLDNAEKKPGVLPAWWNKTKRDECIEFGKGSHEWVDLGCCVEKADIMKHYGDDMMPMKLRMLAESFCGVGPWGTPATSMRRMMMSTEG
jgi:splicing suppressor protein 51